MISVELARALRRAGVRWRPTPGDRFAIEAPELEGEVFTLSEMTVEAREYPTGTILGFNGTTEWALDSVSLDQALWLPHEDQLRELLGGTFRTLAREDGGYRVVTSVPSSGDGEATTTEHRADDAADAYALALLDLVSRAVG